MSALFMALLSVILVSLVSLVGIAAFSLRQGSLSKVLFLLVALAAGALLGDAFIHLIPESLSVIGSPVAFGFATLLGLSLFFILEKVLRWHHAHHGDESEHVGHEKFERGESHQHLAPMVLLADGMHNIVDGAVIAASYLVSPALGVATTVAVFLHEVPQEIADYALLIHAGFSRTRALMWNFISGLTALIGAGLVFALGSTSETFGAYAAAVTAGAFIYLAAADLIPDLQKQTNTWASVSALGAFLVGIGAMFALTLLETH